MNTKSASNDLNNLSQNGIVSITSYLLRNTEGKHFMMREGWKSEKY